MPVPRLGPPGTLVLSSGLGGVYPKGIPVGTVTGIVREQTGWERVYRLRPAANPGSAAHVLVLVTPPDVDLARAFPSDSALEAMRLDSIARVRRADSLADAERLARPPAPSRWPRSAATRRSCRRPGARPRRHRRPGPRPPSRPAAARPRPAHAEPGHGRQRPMNVARANRLQLALVLAVLVLLHFYVRPRLWSAAGEPGLPAHGAGVLLHAGRAGRGRGGGVPGRAGRPTRSPRRASARARWRIRSWATWSPGPGAVFFADNLAVYAGFVAAALWLRDLVLLVASGTDHSPLLAEVTLYSPLQALITALFTLLILAAFREWFAIRLDL